jgi:hypothetical protein
MRFLIALLLALPFVFSTSFKHSTKGANLYWSCTICQPDEPIHFYGSGYPRQEIFVTSTYDGVLQDLYSVGYPDNKGNLTFDKTLPVGQYSLTTCYFKNGGLLYLAGGRFTVQ